MAWKPTCAPSDSERHEHHLHVNQRPRVPPHAAGDAGRHDLSPAPPLVTSPPFFGGVGGRGRGRRSGTRSPRPASSRRAHAAAGFQPVTRPSASMTTTASRADLDERLEVLLLAADARVRERRVGDVDTWSPGCAWALRPRPWRSTRRRERRPSFRQPGSAGTRRTRCSSPRARAAAVPQQSSASASMRVEDGREERRIHPRLARIAKDLLKHVQ